MYIYIYAKMQNMQTIYCTESTPIYTRGKHITRLTGFVAYSSTFIYQMKVFCETSINIKTSDTSCCVKHYKKSSWWERFVSVHIILRLRYIEYRVSYMLRYTSFRIEIVRLNLSQHLFSLGIRVIELNLCSNDFKDVHGYRIVIQHSKVYMDRGLVCMNGNIKSNFK